MIIKEIDAVKHQCAIDINQKCCGAQCMAWKWKSKMVEVPQKNTSAGLPLPVEKTKISKTKGYCGHIGI